MVVVGDAHPPRGMYSSDRGSSPSCIRWSLTDTDAMEEGGMNRVDGEEVDVEGTTKVGMIRVTDEVGGSGTPRREEETAEDVEVAVRGCAAAELAGAGLPLKDSSDAAQGSGSSCSVGGCEEGGVPALPPAPRRWASVNPGSGMGGVVGDDDGRLSFRPGLPIVAQTGAFDTDSEPPPPSTTELDDEDAPALLETGGPGFPPPPLPLTPEDRKKERQERDWNLVRNSREQTAEQERSNKELSCCQPGLPVEVDKSPKFVHCTALQVQSSLDRLYIFTIMLGDCLLIICISIFTALLGEGLTWLLVYRTEKYQKLKQEVDKQSKKVEKMKELHGEGTDKQTKKRVGREEDKLKANSRDLQFVKMKSMLAIGFVFTALLSTFNTIFDGRVVAKLPFVPISWIQGISHRNLLGNDYTDCSFLFLYILCTMFVRQNIQKLLGFAPSRAASRQSSTSLFSPPSNQFR
ncbi:unnamed protein product [Cyprideis torosa]|uniref:Uncharacterized protein n=1 Tax=Cyprideis torosa TaxID=163714 RepID=A0A7R8ZLK0_9CRUS|nr:unnamed protein product [Cyprideis torosa]CAG0882432.1 unnamed protein product [Cyprideis torosa]